MGALVSIIVPAYNAENFISECVESIISQSYKDIEIIVVDDGSKDRTGEICDDLAQKSDKVRVIHQSNAGVSAARNAGIAAAEGEYICFTDADDSLPQAAIQTLSASLLLNNADAVYGNYRYVYESGRTIDRLPRITPNVYTISELKLIDDGTLSGITFGSACAAIYKTEIIRKNSLKFRTHLKTNEDGVFNIEYCLCSDKVCYIPDIVYNYRQWKSNKTPNIEQLAQRLGDSTEEIKKICKIRGISDLLEEQIKARELFVIFQTSVAASSMKYKVAAEHYKNIWQSPEIARSNSVLTLENTGTVKKLLWNMIKQKKYRSFYFAVHYAYPVLGKIIKR